ncbi:MAG: DOMON-like domain-containing protein [Sphingomonas sp.]|nr:DOMON-like domain-containing protein [Sphingomonas sp.]
MQRLVRHPDAPPGAIQAVEGELVRTPLGATATFRAIGDVSRLVIPPPASPARADDLWQTSCFELFVGGEGSSYREFNFSPSGAWAAYRFDDYRDGMAEAEARVSIETVRNARWFELVARIDADFPRPVQVGLTAVIEETDGVIRYWSASFAPGKADFHAAAVRSLLFDGVSAQ